MEIKARKYPKRVTVYCYQSTREEIEELAHAERRSLSVMMDILLLEALKARREAGKAERKKA